MHFTMKICRHLWLILLLVTNLNLGAQSNVADSLRNLLAVSKTDTVLYEANRLMAMHFWESNPDSSIFFGTRALAIARKISNKSKIAMGYQAIGVAYDYKDNLDSALFFLNEGLMMYKSINNADGSSHILSDIAIAHYYRGNYELALRNHFTALEYRQQSGNKRFIAISYNNIGLVYRSRKEYGNAATYYQKSLMIKKEIHDEQGILNSLINIGSAFQSEGKYDSAYFYANEALKLAIKIGAQNDILASKANLAAAMVNLGQNDEALVLLHEVEEKSFAANITNNLFSVYESLGDALTNKGQLEKAEKYYNKGLEISTKKSRLEQKGVFLKKLARNYKSRGLYNLAYEFLEKGERISDTLFTVENSRQINEMAALYGTQEKERRIKKLNKDNIENLTLTSRIKRERNYFILSSILLLGMAAITYMALRSHKKKEQQLDMQNAIIENSLVEKEFLMKEIHHRVKNNLQIVSSLLKLQSRYIKDEQAQEAVKEGRNRVQAMALIHQNLYQEENLTGIDVADYIGKLCENLFQSYNIHPQKIKLIKEIPPLNLDIDTVVPLGLILNELITNSLKYAFPQDKYGTVKIELKEDNTNLIVRIYDNGVGLPDGYEQKNSETFGFKMISAFLQKLKGTMRIYTDDGTKVEVIIPNQQLIK